MDDRTVIDPGPGSPPAYGQSDATQVISPGYGGDVTQQAIAVTCAVCDTPNMPGEIYCQDCGFLLTTSPDQVEAITDTAALPRLMDSSGQEFVLVQGPNSVGRDSADVLLPDPTVSRRHATITLEGTRVFVEDCGSTNGSSVAGRKLAAGERGEAYEGDTVKFGNIILTLRLPDGSARPAAEAAAPEASALQAVDRGEPVAYLTLIDGTEHPLFAGENSVGRKSTNQIAISDLFLSGNHARIVCEEEGSFKLIDLGSTNGSFKDGVRLAPHVEVELAPGETFSLGKTPLSIRPAGEAAEGEPTRMLETDPETGPSLPDAAGSDDTAAV